MPKLISNTSALVVSQIPDYIRGDYVSYVSGSNIVTADYSKFIHFVEAYYKFLEKETNPTEVLQNAILYADVEKTIDTANVSLVESFFKNYGSDIPRNLLTNKKSFVKFFRNIYETKGTEEAAKLLFRVLYNNTIEFSYPGDFIFKASDGRWKNYKTLLVVPVNSANIFGALNTIITGQDSNATAKVVNVLKILKPNKLFGFGSVSDDITEYYELYLENIDGNFRKETIVSSLSSNIKANTYYQLASIEILNGGKGYDLNANVRHLQSTLKVSKVNNFGEIKEITVVDSGVYYPSSTISTSFTPSFVNVEIDSPSKLLQGNVSVIGRKVIFISNTYHYLSKNDSITLKYYGNTLSNFNDGTNTVTISKIVDDKRFIFYLNSFSNTNLSANLTLNSTASLRGNLGILKTNKGFLLNSKGRLSDRYKIQGALADSPDSSILYYQPFSYVIRSSETTSKWKEIVKTTIHPSGVEVFGDVLLIKDLDSIINDTGKSEVQDYLGLTADYFNNEILANSTFYTFSKTGFKFSINADHVILIFGYL